MINPRAGNPWAQVPGTPGGADTSYSMFIGPTATLTASSTAIRINDLSRVGLVGQTISFGSAAGGFQQIHPYWIVSKSAAAGGGTITVAWAPGGKPIASSASTTIQVSDPVQSESTGDRANAPGKNTFGYDPVKGNFLSAYNQTDVKGEIAGITPQMAPVFEVSAKNKAVVLNSRMYKIWYMYPGNGYRVWNRFEDLGSGGYTGELYTDRTTGLIYYTPRTDLKETCATINAAGQAIIPSYLETLLKISSATADIAAAGVGAAGAAVGNLVFKHIIFEYTNTSVFTGVDELAGATGGFMTTQSARYAGPLNYAVATIGATNVTFDTVAIAHLGGSALGMAWGSNHDTVQNSQLYDAGGTLITAGAATSQMDNYHYNSDPSYYGTSAFGPSTPSFNAGAGATKPDLTGNSDCCQTFTNNLLYNGGLVHPGMSCIGISGWQQFTITHNTVHDCGPFGIAANTYTGISAGPPSFMGVVGAVKSGSSVYYPFYGNVFSYNEIYDCNYETTVMGALVPGGEMSTDVGCFYITGPQDGDGTNTANALQVTYNKIHDISAAPYPILKWQGTKYVIGPRGYDAVLDYHDCNCANGVIEKYNLFYNRSSATVGATVYPTRITQHTGNMRSVITNNIFASVFPSGVVIYNDYLPRADVTPNFNIPDAASNVTYAAGVCTSTCYVVSNYNIYSSTFTNSRTTGNNTPPTCAGGSCTDGGVTWTWVEKLPGTPYLQDYSNITAWKVEGDAAGATKDYPMLAYPFYPQWAQFSGNLYSMAGNYLVKASGAVTFAQWLADKGAQGVTQDLGSLYGRSVSPDAPGILPNFVSLDTGNFAFNSTYAGPGVASACAGTGAGTVSPACGLGFVPWDYSNVGAH